MKILKEEYLDDIDIILGRELKHVFPYLNGKEDINLEMVTHQDLYKIVFDDKIEQAFPNVEVVLCLFLTLMVTNCSGERSFSGLKRIKHELRTTMKQEKLCSLSLCRISSEV